MSRLRIRHVTRYAYASPAAFSQHLMRLTPPDGPSQRVLAAALEVTPKPDEMERFEDAFGNAAAAATVAQPHEVLEITATSTVERLRAPDLMQAASSPWETVAAAARAQAGLPAAPFAFPTRFTEADDALEAWARQSFRPGRPVLEAARELCARIHEAFAYLPGATSAETAAQEAFRAREGVCQDFAHVMLAACRAVGTPAAYVSGYLRTLPPPGQPRLIGADATHAWVAVWDPAAGWTEFDPTNDMEPGLDHVALARGRDYADCAPVTGLVVGSGGQTLSVSVDVAEEGEARAGDEAAPA
ncbi:MAG: transglutaminase family protein [Pseudomonadota bacterium]